MTDNHKDLKGKIEWKCLDCGFWFHVDWDYQKRVVNCPKCGVFIGNKF